MSLSNILTKRITNYDNPHSLASKFRERRIVPLLSMMSTTYAANGEVNIIDIGGTKAYWNILPSSLLDDLRVTITVVNLPDCELPIDDDHFKFLKGDGCNLDNFENNSFDVVHSNSVIEHVGDWNQMVKFAEEARRLAPNLFIQTPYFWFPIEPHFMTPFFHWLPRPIRINLVLRFNLGNHKRSDSVHEAAAKLENYRLLDKTMFQALFPDTIIQSEIVMRLTKSIIAVRFM